MIIHDNEFETKENKIWTKDKIEPQQRYDHRFLCLMYILLIAWDQAPQ